MIIIGLQFCEMTSQGSEVGTRFFALIIHNKMAALFHVSCGTTPWQLCHYSMSTVALFHVSCGTIPCQLWHYSMSNVPLLPLRQANRMFPEDVQTFSWFVWYQNVDSSKLCLYTRPTPTVLASLRLNYSGTLHSTDTPEKQPPTIFQTLWLVPIAFTYVQHSWSAETTSGQFFGSTST